mgnify:CR=1 FL=1
MSLLQNQWLKVKTYQTKNRCGVVVYSRESEQKVEGRRSIFHRNRQRSIPPGQRNVQPLKPVPGNAEVIPERPEG